MATTQVSGPAFIYIARQLPAATPTGAQLFFLGTCEQPPSLQLNPQWEPIMNDVGGSLLPIEYTYQGEDGLLSGVLNKWNEAVYAALATHGLLGQIAQSLGRGADLWSDIGTMAQLEGITFQTFLHFPYASKTPNAAQSMPNGYRFLACRLASHVIGPGTRAGRRQLIIHTDRANMETASSTTSKFKLYDNVMTNIPAVPPIIAAGNVA